MGYAQLLKVSLDEEINWEKKYFPISHSKKNNLIIDYENEYIYIDNAVWSGIFNSFNQIRIMKLDFVGEEILHADFGVDMEREYVLNL